MPSLSEPTAGEPRTSSPRDPGARSAARATLAACQGDTGLCGTHRHGRQCGDSSPCRKVRGLAQIAPMWRLREPPAGRCPRCPTATAAQLTHRLHSACAERARKSGKLRLVSRGHRAARSSVAHLRSQQGASETHARVCMPTRIRTLDDLAAGKPTHGRQLAGAGCRRFHYVHGSSVCWGDHWQ
jgi:hypothetical protein